MHGGTHYDPPQPTDNDSHGLDVYSRLVHGVTYMRRIQGSRTRSTGEAYMHLVQGIPYMRHTHVSRTRCKVQARIQVSLTKCTTHAHIQYTSLVQGEPYMRYIHWSRTRCTIHATYMRVYAYKVYRAGAYTGVSYKVYSTPDVFTGLVLVVSYRTGRTTSRLRPSTSDVTIVA